MSERRESYQLLTAAHSDLLTCRIADQPVVQHILIVTSDTVALYDTVGRV